MRKFKLNLLMILITVYGCNQSTVQQGPENGTVGAITGNAFFQPIDKNISLALASSTTYITAEFLDSTYCTITYHGYRSFKSDKKYSLDDEGLLKIMNPVNDKVKSFRFISEDGVSYLCRVSDNSKLFKVLALDELNAVSLKGNELLTKSFLYPVLDVKEQEYGAEDRYVKGDDGTLRSIEHPLKKQIRKIDIYELF